MCIRDSFEAMDDAYMKERAADIKDIGKRLMAALKGVKRPDLGGLTRPVSYTHLTVYYYQDKIPRIFSRDLRSGAPGRADGSFGVSCCSEKSRKMVKINKKVNAISGKNTGKIEGKILSKHKIS